MADLIVSRPVFRSPSIKLSPGIEFSVREFKALALLGVNGSGKSMFAEAVVGQMALESGHADLLIDGRRPYSDEVAQISFRDVNSLTNQPDSYYQKRWNATENEDCPKVIDILGSRAVEANMPLINRLGATHILQKHIIQISSGELRKLLIIRALLKKPKLLCIDNPYIGLDEESRENVKGLLAEIVAAGTTIILTLCNTKDLTQWLDRVLVFKGLDVAAVRRPDDLLTDRRLIADTFGDVAPVKLPITKAPFKPAYRNAFVMKQVGVSFYGVEVLKPIDWMVAAGEKWALLGPNGCGKSTLLSFVSADNPQGYAKDITIFDRRRGTGESIWEIKSRIGYMTPDMHTFYRENITALDVVATGFLDTIGTYIKPTDEQRAAALKWMRAFGADYFAGRSFLSVSYGEQRLALLCRTFVKEPELLILDEPLHGLDETRKGRAAAIIDAYCGLMNPTLVYVTHYRNEIPECVTLTKRLEKATA